MVQENSSNSGQSLFVSFLHHLRTMPDISDLEKQLAEESNRFLSLQEMVDDLASKFLGNLKNLRDSHAAVAVASSGTIAGEPSSVTKIISECETALTLLNCDLGILLASIAREQGGDANL